MVSRGRARDGGGGPLGPTALGWNAGWVEDCEKREAERLGSEGPRRCGVAHRVSHCGQPSVPETPADTSKEPGLTVIPAKASEVFSCLISEQLTVVAALQ